MGTPLILSFILPSPFIKICFILFIYIANFKNLLFRTTFIIKLLYS